MSQYRIIQVVDAEGRTAYQLARTGEEPSGQLFYTKQAAEAVAREYTENTCDACGGVFGACSCELND
jgi:hypothetical protein